MHASTKTGTELRESCVPLARRIGTTHRYDIPHIRAVPGLTLAWMPRRPGACDDVPAITLASSRVSIPSPGEPMLPLDVLEPLLFGTACYLLGLVTGARLIPRLVDRGLIPVIRRDPREP